MDTNALVALAEGIGETEALDQQIREMVEPLRAKKDDLLSKKATIQERLSEYMKTIDSQVKQIDQMLKVVEPATSKPKKKESKSKPQNCSEALLEQTLAALAKMDKPVTSRQLYDAHFDGKVSRASINNALTILRERGDIRLAGVAERNARMYAMPLKAVE